MTGHSVIEIHSILIYPAYRQFLLPWIKSTANNPASIIVKYSFSWIKLFITNRIFIGLIGLFFVIFVCYIRIGSRDALP
jgi:hypothetical protein